LGALLASSAGFANPSGPQIVAGQVSFLGSGNQLLITNSPGAIINWQNFSINPGELTRFIQQNSSSAVLNRITGQNPSQILGALQSNGKVFLINPNGVLFGAGAQVNVNGLVASSLNLSNADFLSGKLDFSSTGKPGNVSNRGAITTPSGGQVYLIAPNVTNAGLITAPNGDVLLAAGQSVNLADSNDPDLRVVISAPGNQALNVGKVVAESGRVGIYGAFVNQLGLVSANSAVAGENGKIVLKSSGETLLGAGSVTSATGAGSGGEIQVLGDRVALTADAAVDAGGQTGGGTVLIGGDLHGGNPAIQNAALTYVGPMAQIHADALQSGNGGTVIVWSNQQTQMYGNISARGGAQGGDGGLVESSSKGILDFRGAADLRAPMGASGRLLLDPSDITIGSGLSTDDISLPASAPFTITGTQPTSTLSTTALQNELNLGNVTVSTSSSASAPSGGTISVAAPIAWSNSNSLTLAADRGISINAPITAAAGTLVLTAAGGSIAQSVNLTTPAAITVSALLASAPNGSVTLTEPTNNISGAIAGVGAQGFSLRNSGAIVVGTVASVSGISSSAGLIAMTSAGNIDVADPTVGINAGSNPVSLSSAGMVTTSNGVITGSALDISAATGVGSLVAPLRTAVQSLQVTNSTSGDISVSNTGGPLAISDIGSLGYGIQQTSSGNIYLNSDNVVTLNNAIQILGASGNVGLQAAGGIVLNNSITVPAASGTVALLAANGDIMQNVGSISAASVSAAAPNGSVGLNDATNSVGTIAGSAANSFTLIDGNSFTVGSVAGVGAIPSARGITSSGALGVGVVLETPSAGDITLSAPVSGGSAEVMVYAPAGAIVQQTGGLITAGSLSITAGTTGIGSGAAPVLTNVGTLLNAQSQGSIYLNDSAGLTVYSISALGAVNVNSGGSLTIPAITACDCTRSISGSSITLTAYGPMLLNAGSSITATNGVALYAGYDAASGSYVSSAGTLTADGSISGSTIDLFAAGAINISGAMTGVLTQTPLQFSSTPPPPSLAQCIAAPALAGCSSVLPTLAQCTTAPTTLGCSVVLPTLAQCTAAPTTPGCSVVLPTVAQCTTTPTAPGCSVVLPTVAQCTAAPTAPGCSVVLPTVAQCTTTPTTPGCSVVLPTVAQCTTTPTTPGCSVVLPTVAQCTTTPTTPGCSVVLPTVAQCTTAPTTPGCSVVLPTVAQCTTAPTTPGCSVVLPTVAQCTTTPTAPGCSVVLPTVAQCTAAPTAPGCSVVLPTIAQCTAAPTAPGCSVVLPTVVQCSSDPSLPGCNTVVPPSIMTVASSAQSNVINTINISTNTNAASFGGSDHSSTNDNGNSSTNTGTTNSAAKENTAAKKMYCN
jgi:filamentous hemagglutinin family protein